MLIDVMVFVIVSFSMALISVSCTWLRWRFNIDLQAQYSVLGCLSSYLEGANWCISSVAIYNLIALERKFDSLGSMRKFRPFMKFLCIKLMVLVAFWSSLLMGMLCSTLQLTTDGGELLDASFRIYVMAIIAFLNLYAWQPWSGWYEIAKICEEENINFQATNPQNDLTDISVKNIPKGVLSLVKRLLPGLDEEAEEDFQQVSLQVNSGGACFGLNQVSSTTAQGAQAPRVPGEDFMLQARIGWVLCEGGASELEPGIRGWWRKNKVAQMDERKLRFLNHLETFYPEF